MDVENSSRTGGCFEWNTTQKEDGKSGSYSMTTNEKHALKSVAQSWRKRWDCNRFQTMENTLTRFQFAKSLSRKNIFHRFSISSLPPLPPFKDPCVPPLADHHCRLSRPSGFAIFSSRISRLSPRREFLLSIK